MTESKKKRIPINRWIIVLLLVAIVIASSIFAPVRPAVLLPGEPITDTLFTLPVIGEFKLTNTLLTTILVDLILVLMAVAVKRGLGDETRPSRGLALAVETVLEGLYNTAEATAGKRWARTAFPIMATIILMVLVANLIKLLPGMESIGWMEHAHHGPGYVKVDVIPGVLSYIVNEKAKEDGHGEGKSAEGENPEEKHSYPGYEVVPFFRSPSTDLNFTASLALIAVVMVQVVGVRANGLRYFTKFFNFGRFLKMWSKPDLNAFDAINPFIDIFAGLLELIAEFAKIISFSFRLLGSMFGGAILVIVIGSLLPIANFGVLFLELFFGVIQALVFGMLTLVFMASAAQAHGGHESEQGHAH